MMTRAESFNRARVMGVGFGLAGAAAGAAFAGGSRFVGAMAFVAIGSLGIVLAFSGLQWPVIQGPLPDEREISINEEATRLAYAAVLVVTMAGFVNEMVRATPGPFTLLGAVAGVTNLLAVVYLKRRR